MPRCIPERWTRPRLLPCLEAAPAPTLARENAGRREDRRLPLPHAAYLEVGFACLAPTPRPWLGSWPLSPKFLLWTECLCPHPPNSR